MNFKLPFSRKSYLALTSDSESSMLSEITRSQSGSASLRVLARTDSPVTAEVSTPRLLAGTSALQGQAAMSLPLSFFELVSLSIPVMPDGAVGKALPYHLAKSLNSPLNEFTFDWQITGRFKDRLQLAVYLFPVATFHKIRREFLRKQLTLDFFEPDVFSAFAFLDQEKVLPPNEASLCALLWQDSISLAVFEKGKICLSRTVKSARPQEEFTLSPPATTPEQPKATPEEDILILDQTPVAEKNASDHLDILADFLVLKSSPATAKSQTEAHLPTESQALTAPAAAEETAVNSWTEYLGSVPLEIMRTRDYYAAIQKGGAIKNIFVGGADAFWPELAESCDNLLGLKCKPLTATGEGEESSSLLQALAIGAGARW